MNNSCILGIDPGLNVTGYGLIEIKGNKPFLINYGTIRTESKKELSERLYKIFESLNEIMFQFQPHYVAIEDIFYAENVKTAIVMGHARGTAIVAAKQNGAQVSEYTAREVKMSVVGNGAAAKSQVNYMVANILRVKEKITPNDASDALAIALCKWNRLERELKGLK